MKTTYNGQIVEMDRVTVASMHEPRAAEILLQDGTVITLRLVLGNVYRLQDVTAPNGGPVYQVRNQVVMDVIPG